MAVGNYRFIAASVITLRYCATRSRHSSRTSRGVGGGLPDPIHRGTRTVPAHSALRYCLVPYSRTADWPHTTSPTAQLLAKHHPPRHRRNECMGHPPGYFPRTYLKDNFPPTYDISPAVNAKIWKLLQPVLQTITDEKAITSPGRICIAPLGPTIQRRLMQHRRTKWVLIDGFSSGVWKWECFRTVECQQVDSSSRWMEQQQKKRDGPVRCVCEERRASEHRKGAEPEVVHGSVPAGWDTLEWMWSAHCESVRFIL